MGVADSPLRDRVIFVQGAPRSGTTWLVMLLATHPQIAGVEAESHVFEFGVDRLFDNFERRDRHLRGLRTYLERNELIDLTRDLCDGVLLAMRSHVSGGDDAEFVVEKTPTSFPQGSLDLQRKLECFPDAWYLHIVRDGEAVTRSLMRAPFMHDRSAENCNRLWRECVGFTREVLADHPRYREVSYEEMCADPAKVGGELFRLLGLDASEETLQTVRSLSRERFAELRPISAQPAHSASPGAGGARRVMRLARATLDRAERRVLSDGGPDISEDPELGFSVVRALYERDVEALRSMTTDSMTLTYRSPDGDLLSQGDEAREALLAIAQQLFAHSLTSELWRSVAGAPRESQGRGRPLGWTFFFSGLGGNANRVDLAFGLAPEDGLIADVVIVSAGSPRGRPLRELSPKSLRPNG